VLCVVKRLVMLLNDIFHGGKVGVESGTHAYRDFP